MRLCQKGYDIGLLDGDRFARFRKKKAEIESALVLLDTTHVKPTQEMNAALESLASVGSRQKSSLADLLRRPELDLKKLSQLPLQEPLKSRIADLSSSPVAEEIQLEIKFHGYIERQREQVERFRKMEAVKLPEDLDYGSMSGLSNEVVEKLSTVRPLSLGQASRISGITPAAISVLQVHLRRLKG